MARILIIEDEPDIVMSLEEDLRRQGHEAEHAGDGERGLAMASRGGWELILLDVMLPKVDGLDVCATLRRGGDTTPILMLTARAQIAEKEQGLDIGADDYLTKPFNLRELRARIRALLRRTSAAPHRTVEFGNCRLDFERAELRRNGDLVDITPQELRLMEVFVRNRGRALSRDRIIAAAWGHGAAITERAVDTHVWNLRRKIERDPSAPRFLVGVRGLGYRFDDTN